jgi:carboxyl-terminal processing protease
MIKRYLIILLASLMMLACKKSKNNPPATNPADENPPATSNRRELSQDSIFLYAKQVYYWNENLPTYKAFNPRGYVAGSSDLAKYENELLGIAQFSTNKYDVYQLRGVYQNDTKFSYISDITAQNPTGVIRDKSLSVDLEGNGNDVGLRIVPYLLNETTRAYSLFVTAVYDGSPAALAGMKRGMVINKINGTSFGANFENERTSLNSALNASAMTVEGITFNTKVPFSHSLTKASYKSSPVYAQKVITAGSKKIGYFALARFSKLSNTSGVASDDVIDPIFSNFASSGVTDLIIDLRYNGGGYIQTAEHLMNLIIPPAHNSKVMYAEHYNKTMQDNLATLLKNQPLPDSDGKVQYFNNGQMVTYFNYQTNPYSVANNTSKFIKKGSLNGIQSVIFLVTEDTASSSELMINCLKPYVTVKVVGATTYGKPIGFYPIVIENRYKVYFSMFDTKNSLGQGGYYNGIVPDLGFDEAKDATGKIWDDVRFDFGDPAEGYLATALGILAPGVTVTSFKPSSVMTLKDRTVKVQDIQKMLPVKGKEFVGMIDDKPRFKK